MTSNKKYKHVNEFDSYCFNCGHKIVSRQRSAVFCSTKCGRIYRNAGLREATVKKKYIERMLNLLMTPEERLDALNERKKSCKKYYKTK